MIPDSGSKALWSLIPFLWALSPFLWALIPVIFWALSPEPIYHVTTLSTGRRIKSWLRAKMSQKRFNHVALLNTHETRTDNLRLVNVANEFTARNENRKRNVGTFTVQDLLPWSVWFYRLVLISSLLVTVVVLTCSCSTVYNVSLLQGHPTRI